MQKSTILITGSSGDIAIELINKLKLKSGYKFVLHFKDEKSYERVKDELKGIPMIKFFLDFNDILSIEKKIKKINLDVDILINNVGYYDAEEFLSTDIREIIKQININYLGMLVVTHEIAKKMQKNRKGQIISISSGSGIHGGTLPSFGYASSKNSINFMTAVLAKELGKSNLKINAVVLRYVRTRMFKRYQKLYEKINLKSPKISLRIYSPEEVSQFIINMIDNNKIKNGEIIELK